MGPIDYTTDIASPFESALKGYQAGVGISQIQQQQQQQQVALAQKQQQAQVIQSLLANPSASGEDYAKAMLLVPSMSEPLKQSWDMKSAAAQKQQLSDLSQWGAAIQNGQHQIVVDGLNTRADAIENTAGGPTIESKALRAKAQAVQEHPEFGGVIIKSMLAVHPQGKAVIDNIVAQRKDDRDQKESDSKVAGEAIDQAVKNYGVVAQKAGALAKPGVKPSQVQTFFRTMTAQGFIPKDQLQGYLDGIPADPKELPSYLGQIRDGGMKPDDQKKYTTPDANTVANNERIAAEGAANRANQVKVTQMVTDREAGGDDAASFTSEAIDNAAARYNIDGTLPPMGMGKAAAAGRTKILNRAAEMRAGVDPEQQRRDQLNNKGDVAARNAAVRSFATGKDGQAVQAANTALNHLDTIRQLAMAQKNKDWRAFNQLSRTIGAQFGQAAPTDMKAALIMVAPEISKAVVGVSGTGHEREQAVDALNPNNSLDQIISGTGVMQELFGGRLTEARRTYERTTGKKDFREAMLSPAAQRVIDRAHDGGAGGPAAGAVEAGKDGKRYRFKGGDAGQASNWELVR